MVLRSGLLPPCGYARLLRKLEMKRMAMRRTGREEKMAITSRNFAEDGARYGRSHEACCGAKMNGEQ
jgi:hypothetical protein